MIYTQMAASEVWLYHILMIYAQMRIKSSYHILMIYTQMAASEV